VTAEELRVALQAELAPLLRRLGKSDRRLLSKREAARRLGIDRNTTLRDLIDGGEIRTVVIAGRVKIPASEIERLCEPAPAKPPKSIDSRRPDRDPGRAIRALPF
jgi:excisionase family DNA binding protein